MRKILTSGVCDLKEFLMSQGVIIIIFFITCITFDILKSAFNDWNLKQTLLIHVCHLQYINKFINFRFHINMESNRVQTLYSIVLNFSGKKSLHFNLIHQIKRFKTGIKCKNIIQSFYNKIKFFKIHFMLL